MSYIKRLQFGETFSYQIVEDLVETALDILDPFLVKASHPSNGYVNSRWTVYTSSLPDDVRRYCKGDRPSDTYWPQVVKELFTYRWLINPYVISFIEHDQHFKEMNFIRIEVGADYFAVISDLPNDHTIYHSIRPLASTDKSHYFVMDHYGGYLHSRRASNPLQEAMGWLSDLITCSTDAEQLAIRYWHDHCQHYLLRDLEVLQGEVLDFIMSGQPGQSSYRVTSEGNLKLQYHVIIDTFGHYTVLYEGRDTKGTLVSKALYWVD